MRLQHKLLIAPGVVLALVALAGSVGFLGFRAQSLALDDVHLARFPAYEKLASMTLALSDANANAHRAVSAAGSRSDHADAAAAILVAIDRVGAELRAESARKGLDQAKSERLSRAFAELGKYRREIGLALETAGTQGNASVTAMHAAQTAFGAARKELGELLSSERAENQASHAAASAAGGRALAVAGFMLLLALVGGIAASIYLARHLVRPLIAAKDAAARIAGGDLTRAIGGESGDEISELLDSLEAMRTRLREMIEVIARSTSDFSLSAAELAQGAEKVAGASQMQADSAASMAVALEQMTASINHMSRNAGQARELSERSGRVAQEGGEVIHNTLEEMRNISGTVNQAAERIRALGGQSSRISAIVGVIKEIADQTNLLALNAAIEAARAGDQGRGFAVVADEVRRLAERTSRSTEEIASMVGSIQSGAEDAVAEMGRTVEAAGQGVALAESARESTRQITASAGSVVQEVTEISGALGEQSNASSDIARRVDAIVRMAEENSSAAQGSAGAARRMREHADAIQGHVSRFIL